MISKIKYACPSLLFNGCLSMLITLLFACTNASNEYAITLHNDLELYDGWVNTSKVIKSDHAHSGQYVSKTDATDPYSLGYITKLWAQQIKTIDKVKAQVYIYAPSTAQGNLVVSVEENGKPISFRSSAIADYNTKGNSWVQISTLLKFDKPITTSEQTELRVYVAYAGQDPILIDDFDIFIK
ncbi:MAG: hypothetical protein RIQ89_296 [Bacteroidota bacterium]